MPCARCPDEKRHGEIGRYRHVHEAVWERRIEDHLQPIDGHDTAVDDLEALRCLHPAIGGENPGCRYERPDSHHDSGEEVQARPDLIPSEQHHAKESGFEEEGGQHLVAEQRARDGSCEGRVIAPVGAELVGHDDAGNDAHGEVDGEYVRPEIIEVAISGIFLPQPQAFQHREIARKADGGRGEDDVCRYRESEFDPREFECSQAEHDYFPSAPPAAASGVPVASKTSGAARTEAALTIGLLTERSSSSTAHAVCDDGRPLTDRIWIATTTAERPATTAAASSAATKPVA